MTTALALALLRDPAALDDGAEEWLGFRPTLPDSLPIIDTHPRFPAIHFAFGHQYLGLPRQRSPQNSSQLWSAEVPKDWILSPIA